MVQSKNYIDNFNQSPSTVILSKHTYLIIVEKTANAWPKVGRAEEEEQEKKHYFDPFPILPLFFFFF